MKILKPSKDVDKAKYTEVVVHEFSPIRVIIKKIRSGAIKI